MWTWLDFLDVVFTRIASYVGHVSLAFLAPAYIVYWLLGEYSTMISCMSFKNNTYTVSRIKQAGGNHKFQQSNNVKATR